jgi:chromosome segregation ATPase
MTQAKTKVTEQDIVGLRNAIDDLINFVAAAREESRIGFAEVKGEIAEVRGEIAEFKQEVALEFAEVKGEIKVLDSRLKGLEAIASKLPDLAEKIGELKNWKQIAIIVFTSSVSGSLAWFLRGSK